MSVTQRLRNSALDLAQTAEEHPPGYPLELEVRWGGSFSQLALDSKRL